MLAAFTPATFIGNHDVTRNDAIRPEFPAAVPRTCRALTRRPTGCTRS